MVKNGFIYDCHGKWVLRKTRRGVYLLCAIKNGTNNDGLDRISKLWHPLKLEGDERVSFFRNNQVCDG